MRVSSLGHAVVLAVCVPAPAPAASGEALPGPITARVLKIVDGDTIAVRARVWLGQDIEIRVRLDGVDAPELKARCADELHMAERAREFLVRRIAGTDVTLTNIHHGKYAGRVIARVATSDGLDLSQALLEAGLARRYGGERRRPFCDGG